MAVGKSETELERLEEIFLYSSRFEYLFWDMSYRKEMWDLRSKNILQFHNVSFHYDEKPIIHELNASIHEKEFVSIIYRVDVGKVLYFALLQV